RKRRGGDMAIPVIDVEMDRVSGRWKKLGNPSAVNDLLSAFEAEANQTLTDAAGFLGPVLFRAACASADVLNLLLGSHYRNELEDLATVTGASRDRLLLANLAYDLSQTGCSTFVIPRPKGPLHARTLDWEDFAG